MTNYLGIGSGKNKKSEKLRKNITRKKILKSIKNIKNLNNSRRYPLINMTNYGIEKNEDLGGNIIYYNNNNERRNSKLSYKFGRVYKGNDTAKEGKYIFVMDDNGNIYIDFPELDEFHHSSFFGGKAVSAAGTIFINQNYQITAIDNLSGHYKPPSDSLEYVIKELTKMGINRESYMVGYVNAENSIVTNYHGIVFIEFADGSVNTYINKQMLDLQLKMKDLQNIKLNINPLNLNNLINSIKYYMEKYTNENNL